MRRILAGDMARGVKLEKDGRERSFGMLLHVNDTVYEGDKHEVQDSGREFRKVWKRRKCLKKERNSEPEIGLESEKLERLIFQVIRERS